MLAVQYAASSEDTYRTDGGHSRTLRMWPSGTSFAAVARRDAASVPTMRPASAVSTKPGQTQLTRIPSAATSMASVLVNPNSPALPPEKRKFGGGPATSAAIDATSVMLPFDARS